MPALTVYISKIVQLANFVSRRMQLHFVHQLCQHICEKSVYSKNQFCSKYGFEYSIVIAFQQD